MSQNIINTAKSVRQITLQKIQSIPEELFDVQPQQFGNTIKWNVGHIVFSLDFFLSLGLSLKSNLPETYAGLFNTGTKPADWSVTPPTKEELTRYLSEQFESISTLTPDTFDELLQSPIELGPIRFKTVGEVVNFSLIHEAMHLGTISSLVKVIQHDQL